MLCVCFKTMHRNIRHLCCVPWGFYATLLALWTDQSVCCKQNIFRFSLERQIFLWIDIWVSIPIWWERTHITSWSTTNSCVIKKFEVQELSSLSAWAENLILPRTSESSQLRLTDEINLYLIWFWEFDIPNLRQRGLTKYIVYLLLVNLHSELL